MDYFNKTIYFQCNMGASGDMLCGTLFDLIENKNDIPIILDKINSLLSGVNCTLSQTTKCGIIGTKFTVTVDETNNFSHSNLNQIFDIIDTFDLSDKVKTDVKSIYKIIATAESKVHGKEVANIHFHEVGAKDAIIDITTFAILVDYFKPKKIISSPITTGFGTVSCCHGIVSVPAPATLEILKGIPMEFGEINSELCTPTGAALLKYFTDDFVELPKVTIVNAGYGMGYKDFKVANCVRGILCDLVDDNTENDIVELRCNVDDMTGEEMAYCTEKLLDLGAKDVFTQSVVMKKSRMGMLLTVLCSKDIKDKIVKAIFKHTTTIGIREFSCSRYVLDRKITQVNGIRTKTSSGFGVEKSKMEYEDLKVFCDENDLSLFQGRQEDRVCTQFEQV